jgi:hypothetical protein
METLTTCCKQVLRQLDEASAKQGAPAVKLFKEPEPSSAYIPFEPSIGLSETCKEATDIQHGQLPSGFSEPSIISPFQYSAPQEAAQCEKIEATEMSRSREAVYPHSLADGYSAGESQAQDLSTACDISEKFAKPCIEKESDGCVPMPPLATPLPEGAAAMQEPFIRITSVPAETLTADIPVNGDFNEALASPEGAAAVAELSEIPPCPIVRISIENIEEDIDTAAEREGFSEEDQPQTVTIAPEDTDDLSAYYSAAAKEDKILTEQPVEVSVEAGIEDTANFTIVACGQPHKETATAVKIPLIFKIKELNKECLINLIINFNDFTMREPR